MAENMIICGYIILPIYYYESNIHNYINSLNKYFLLINKNSADISNKLIFVLHFMNKKCNLKISQEYTNVSI